ncbi:MAG: glycosyltransferase family 4 protein [Akkermansiaceae bacterium]|nr:glycosyltransferase family 4 protein [Akkermansiaceae bacterium]
MKVIQILPELHTGGVERGTLEVAAALVEAGHESLVISNGGRLVEALEAAGSRHITMPVHRKSLATLGQVRPLRRLLEQEKPDIIHIRSRVPGWVTWLAWRKMDPATRPRLVSTVHGFYSTNFYSAVMTKGERVIAVSNSIRDYILRHYPQAEDAKIRVIHRGVSPEDFPRNYEPSAEWQQQWRQEHPQLEGKKTLLLPGRITRWKGQQDFIELIAALKAKGEAVHGLICGNTHPKKRAFLTELQELAAKLGVEDDITFLGHRSDVSEIMASCDLALSLSRDPEAFGRVSLEAAAIGKPVVGYDHGGVAEQLAALFPQGRVPVGNTSKLLDTTLELLNAPVTPKPVQAPFTREAMTAATLSVYEELHQEPRS